jgi:2-polyprenyl-6-methoxyphenol hydroxylase-like FAD-dependent oxidoreductase
MALEDAVTLGKAMEACDLDFDAAFRLYEAARITRTARVVLSGPRDGPPLPRKRRRTVSAQFAVDRSEVRSIL